MCKRLNQECILSTPLPKEQFSIQNVRFRRALLSDFDAIMAFGDLYEGVDYFMAFYEEFLADADNFCVVAMVEDGVVGYGMTSLVDGGLTVVARCARVHPKYKGRGIFKAILDEVEKHTMRYRHSALYETQNMKSKDENIPLNNPYRPGYKSVHIRETRMIRFLQSTCSKYPDSMETPRSQMGLNGTLRRLRVADLRLLFNTEDVTRELFPSRKLLHFLVAYRLLDANIRHLTCKRSRVLVSLKPSEYACDSPPQNVRPLKLCNTGNNCKQLGLDSDSVRRISMMTNYFCYPTRNKGFSLLLDIHTRSRFSFDSYDIYSDLRAHLEYMKKDMQLRFPGRDGFVSIFYDKPLCTNQVLSCFKDLGIGELVPSGEKHAVTWERPKRVTQSKL